ncbi:MAG: NHLP bacteriocin export ABC transporter permease/ATPase subunit [Clostridia bacterium]|nr:NHLP bacteriocin export ABC transporter permease/ATPase subunit [Clostridia bacterium]
MGWFDEQIKQRKQSDDQLFEEAFVRIADAVLGTKTSAAYQSDDAKASGEIGEILKYYKIKPLEVPETVKGLDDRLEYLLRPHGIMRRNVQLQKGWYRDAIGALLARRKDDGAVVALIPRGLTGYAYFDAAASRWVKIGRKNEELFDGEAICFYKSFPLTKLTVSALTRYILQCIDRADIALVVLSTFLVSLVGLLTPRLTALLFGQVAAIGSVQLLLALATFMISVEVSQILLRSINAMLSARVTTKLNLSVQAATMMRILSLPADFFKKWSSGELASRSQQLQSLCQMLVSSALNTGLTSLFSLMYITQIFAFAPTLVVPALSIILITLVFTIATTLAQTRVARRQMELSAKESGMSYALITGIQKIKLSGAEKRAYARWSDLYARQVSMQYNPPLFLRLNSVISTAISLTGTLVMYFMALQSGVGVSDYYAFTSAYGMVSGAFMSLAGIASTLAQFRPVMAMAKPIMDAEPEVSEGKQVIDRISGAIEVSNVSFRYREDMPLVLDDLSLKIRPGQYVAIVGATGCGKSTLMRILLGFEKPQKGAVYYNGKDLSTIDLKSLRRKIGVVMQNGKLFQGDIYSNIVISAPQLTLDQAWEAAEMAGVAEDIRRMPMGMHTIIAEGSGGISGGQRQRLMIARAIAPKPKILMFDEATSALDNITQKTVSDSLEKLKCTRIVIAHRLSTIRACDRIVYLEKGRIVEDGTYDELIALGGRFAELVERQRLDA